MRIEHQPGNGAGVGVDNLGRGHACSTADQSGNAAELADSQLEAPGATALFKVNGAGGETSVAPEPDNGHVKRKRGRPPRSQGMVGVGAGSAAKKLKKEEENVCFICFDGGSLVLCDRRDCPKVYHPACVKRDEAFFQGKLRWNCGWHLCSMCQKNALFMCYTCPYSLCKGCVKQVDVISVRGNKGFCRTCMATIMLFENVTQGKREVAEVDFDDKSSWEYLFKVYWIYTKQKESLSTDELTQAANLWKELGLDKKADVLPKMHNLSAGIASESSCTAVQLEANASKRRKTRKQQIMQSKESQLIERVIDPVVSCLHDNADWASKDLLEFVAHMKNGDTSELSQYDVQALLLEYIRKQSLRDPRRKCEIICDRRLENLFGKVRVGHFEMLKLLEYHFKEESHASSAIQGAADSVAGQGEAMGSSEDTQTVSRERKRKTNKKGDERGQKNLDKYAAIDAHNIRLIYLKRNLMENLIQDAEKFHNKVVGSVVRIKIPGNDKKADMYRLVRVVGTSKAAEDQKNGGKIANVLLKILNLNKTEDIAIDGISNQEFTEDECGRLRQSIKCGFAQRITVGEIQEKAIALQAVRVNDWLEAEILRLNHLRDRASEMGHQKELREYVDKLELLNTPSERQNRLREIPEVHADPRMDPGYESDDNCGQSDVTKQDLELTLKHSNSNAKGMKLIAPTGVGNSPNSSSSKTLSIASHCDPKRKSARLQLGKDEACAKHSVTPLQPSQTPAKANAASGVLDEPRDRDNASIEGSKHAAATSGNFLGAAADSPSPSVATVVPSASANCNFDMIWHYQDPSGRVQGPFCMLQLRKWSSNGYFPTDLRVWRINEKQDESMLLTEALTRETRSEHNSKSQLQVAENKPNNAADCVGKLSSNCDSAVRGPTPRNETGSPGLTSAVSGGQATNGRRNGKKSDRYGSESGKSQNYLPGMRTLVCGLPFCNPAAGAKSNKKAVLNPRIKPSKLSLRSSEVANKDPKDHSVGNEQLSALNTVQRHSGICQNTSSSCIGFSDMPSPSLKSNLDNVDLNVQAKESDDPGGLTVAGCDLDTKNNSGTPNVHEHNLTSTSTASEDTEFADLVTKPSVASADVETSDIQNYTPKSEPGNVNMNLQGRESQNSGTSNAPEHDANFRTKLGLDNMDRDVQGMASLGNGVMDVLECDIGTKSSCVSDDTKCSGQKNPSSKSEPDNVDLRFQVRESGISDISESDLGTKKSSSSGNLEFCDLPITNLKQGNDAPTVERAEVQHSVDLNVRGHDSGTQWDNWSGRFEITDMPIGDHRADDDDLKGNVLETKEQLASNIPGQGSGISWSTASSLVGEIHLPEAGGEWNQCSQGQTKPPVEEFDSDLVSGCLLKLTEAVSNCATPPHTCQLTHSSAAHPECCTSRWLAMEPIELSTLGDESVSDLLSEVEALESLKLLSSPASKLNSEADPIGSPKSDCFSPLVGLSPHFQPGKPDMQFHSQPDGKDDSQTGFQIDVHNDVKISDVQSTQSPEIEAELDRAFASIQEEESASEANSSAPHPTSIATLNPSTSLDLECNAKTACVLMHKENKSVSQAHPPSHWLPSSTSLDTFLSPGVKEEIKPAFSGVPPQAFISQAQPSTSVAAVTMGISSNGHRVAGGPQQPTIPIHQHISYSRSSSTKLSPASLRVGVSTSHDEDGEVKPSISVNGDVLESCQPAVALLHAGGSLYSSGGSRALRPVYFSTQKEALASDDYPPASCESPQPPATTLDASRSPQGEDGFIPASVSVHEEAVVSEAHPPTLPPPRSPPVHLDSSRIDGVEGTTVQHSGSMHQAGSASEVHQPSTPTTSSPSAASVAGVVVPPPVSVHQSFACAAEVVPSLPVPMHQSILKAARVLLPPVSRHQSTTTAAAAAEVVPPLVSTHQSSASSAEEGEVVPPAFMYQSCMSATEGELLVSTHQSSTNAAEGQLIPPPVFAHQSELVSQSHLPVPETKNRDVTATIALGRPGLLPTPQTTNRDVTAAVALGKPGSENVDTSSRETYREMSTAGRNNQVANNGCTNVHHRGNPVANQGTRPHHQPISINNGGRHSGPKDGNYHHQGILDAGFGRGRSSWNRQPSFGSRGSSRQPPHRGQRVCKFYENGYCRKGASCKYLHP